ncbi:hypothetical protein D3C78_1205210 [compost metagenome]
MWAQGRTSFVPRVGVFVHRIGLRDTALGASETTPIDIGIPSRLVVVATVIRPTSPMARRLERRTLLLLLLGSRPAIVLWRVIGPTVVVERLLGLLLELLYCLSQRLLALEQTLDLGFNTDPHHLFQHRVVLRDSRREASGDLVRSIRHDLFLRLTLTCRQL